MLIVQKFGGSSLSGQEQMARAAQIIIDARREHEVLAVVSAAGDTTDELTKKAETIHRNPPSRELASLLSTGEQQTGAYLAMLLNNLGAEAVSLTGWQAGIVSSQDFLNASVRKILPYKIKAALKKGQIVIVSGFQAVTPAGDISTLGRGGSDTSAAALALALKAGECRIYTDVDGICTADPRIIPDAEFIDKIDYRDMLALSEMGCEVLKSDCVRLSMENSLALRLLSSFRDCPGTLLCRMSEAERPDFAGITCHKERSLISVSGKAAGRAAADMLTQKLKSAGFTAEFSSIGENCLSIKVAREQLSDGLRFCHSILFK